MPEELSDDVSDGGEGQFNTTEGGGLADGQGAKDVSDQVRLPVLTVDPYVILHGFVYVKYNGIFVCR